MVGLRTPRLVAKIYLMLGVVMGSLVHYLYDGKRMIVGIDIDKECINRTLHESNSKNVQF